jgi:hypothetical protein
MIVNNPDNAGLTPGPGISLAILSNNFSALTAVSFATELPVLVGAVSELDGRGLEVGAATEVARLYATSEAVSVAGRRARGCVARDGVGFGVKVPEDCCCTRLGFDCDPCDLSFPNFLNIEENFGDMNLRMMIRSRFGWELDMNTRFRLGVTRRKQTRDQAPF